MTLRAMKKARESRLPARNCTKFFVLVLDTVLVEPHRISTGV
jgi:hypothetical protein